MILTGNILKKICPSLQQARADALSGLINGISPTYSVDNKDKFEEFLATICHESGEFSIKTENMNYKTPARLVEIWPSRFGAGKLNPAFYVNNAEKLANEVYANRMGNGDAASGDGFRYRGAGFCQLTGKESFSRYAKYKDMDIEAVADKVRGTDLYALDSAFWEFYIDKGLMDEAVADDFKKITYRINGGYTNMQDREKYLARCKQHLV